MRKSLPLFLLAVLTALFITPGRAFADLDHPGHNPATKCTWQADILPSFAPGETGVFSSGNVTRLTLLGCVAGTEVWRVVVLPGFHVGFVEAMDQAAPHSSSVSQAYARRSLYNVLRSGDCCRPGRRAKATMSCGFGVSAAVPNSPGSASAQGMTTILATNTLSLLTAAAAVTTDSAGGGADVELEVSGPANTRVKVKFKVDFDSEDESVDETSQTVSSGSTVAVDEEYVITSRHRPMATPSTPGRRGQTSTVIGSP